MRAKLGKAFVCGFKKNRKILPSAQPRVIVVQDIGYLPL